jgi:hypothetical protein
MGVSLTVEKFDQFLALPLTEWRWVGLWMGEETICV